LSRKKTAFQILILCEKSGDAILNEKITLKTSRDFSIFVL